MPPSDQFKHNKRRDNNQICRRGPEKPVQTDRSRPALIAQDVNSTALVCTYEISQVSSDKNFS